ncbi:MAG TPA: VOC family protein [Chroococcales cyanobacterium]
MQKISACLWFDDKAEEAAQFYTSIFPNSKIKQVARYSDSAANQSGRPKGSVMTVAFVIEGQEFLALNGGPIYKFTPAISLMVHCENQQEIDQYVEKLTAGGELGPCGWLTDKFGISWQIVPTVLPELLKDASKAEAVMASIMQMKKLDIETLKKAHAGVK